MNVDSIAARYPNADLARVGELTKKCSENERGCWIWNGAKVRKGYGRVERAGRGVAVHRLMYTLVHGATLTKEQLVCHRCDTPPCCNPDHLFLGTWLDNARDMIAKGRGRSQKKTLCPAGHPYAVYGRSWSTKRVRRNCYLCDVIRARMKAGWTREEAEQTPVNKNLARKRPGVPRALLAAE